MAAGVAGGDTGALGRVALAVLVAAVTAGLACTAASRAGSEVLVHRTVVLGRSVEGRPIVAIEVGDPDNPNKALIVGCIHGTECAGITVADRLASIVPRPGLDLWVVPDLNPDGAAAGTRGNAHWVDLNRNFPSGWRHLTGVFYSGPRALSEPESRAIAKLILRVKPRVSIWFHQHLDVVDESGGKLSIERRFALAAGMRLKRLAREHGSVVGWENHVLPTSTAFVVELPAGALSPPATTRLARVVLAVAGEQAPDARARVTPVRQVGPFTSDAVRLFLDASR